MKQLERVREGLAHLFLGGNNSTTLDPELLDLERRVDDVESLALQNRDRIEQVAAHVGIQDIDWWRAQQQRLREWHGRT